MALKFHKEIDGKAYGWEHQEINKEMTDLHIKKGELPRIWSTHRI